MKFIAYGSEAYIKRRFEYRKLMEFVDEFKTYLKSFQHVGVTAEGLTNLAAKCGTYVDHYYLAAYKHNSTHHCKRHRKNKMSPAIATEKTVGSFS